jgi:hypothetical protein
MASISMLTLVKPFGIPMQKTARVAGWRCFQGSVFQYFPWCFPGEFPSE